MSSTATRIFCSPCFQQWSRCSIQITGRSKNGQSTSISPNPSTAVFVRFPFLILLHFVRFWKNTVENSTARLMRGDTECIPKGEQAEVVSPSSAISAPLDRPSTEIGHNHIQNNQQTASSIYWLPLPSRVCASIVECSSTYIERTEPASNSLD